MVNTYKLEISGKVQGVWYRDWFCKEARKLKITGYIKNLHNPNIVEAIIQGNLDSLNKLIGDGKTFVDSKTKSRN